jgi:rod shape determining protein RodA
MLKRQIFRHFDYWLFGAVVFLCVFGIIMIRSAVAGNVNNAGNVNRQSIFVAIGVAIIIIMAIMDYRFWSSISKFMYFAIVGLLLFILIVGGARFGASRWIETGLISIQPAELAKDVIIIVLADYFARMKNETKDLKWVARSFFMVLGIVIWIVLQPNLSTTIVILIIWFVMMWLGGLPVKYLLIFMLAAVILFGVAFPFLESYQQARILNFLFPDPNARHGNSYNVEQALITIGSGGWFGMGYGHGTQVQLRFLQVRQTDYIFSVIAEEFGFFGTVAVIALLVFVILRCFRAGRMASDTFGSLIAYGFGFLMFFQMVVNIGVNLNLMPVTGLTLPFISYGGSSLISLVIGIGLVESVISRRALIHDTGVK